MVEGTPNRKGIIGVQEVSVTACALFKNAIVVLAERFEP